MSKTILMDVRGRLVLPKILRERLNITRGASLRVEVSRIELSPVETVGTNGLIRKAEILVVKRTGARAYAAAAISAERDAQADCGPRR